MESRYGAPGLVLLRNDEYRTEPAHLTTVSLSNVDSSLRRFGIKNNVYKKRRSAHVIYQIYNEHAYIKLKDTAIAWCFTS